MWKISKERGPWETESDTRWGSKQVPIVVTIEPRGVRVRPKGTRVVLRLPWTTILDKAAEAHALAKRAEKATKRKARITRGKL